MKTEENIIYNATSKSTGYNRKHWIDWSRLNPTIYGTKSDSDVSLFPNGIYFFYYWMRKVQINVFKSPFSGVSTHSALISRLTTLFLATRTHCDWTEPEPLYHCTVMRTNTRGLYAVQTHTQISCSVKNMSI